MRWAAADGRARLVSDGSAADRPAEVQAGVFADGICRSPPSPEHWPPWHPQR